MYNIGICDDGKNICASMEEMILHYMKEREILIEVKVWYTGEALCGYLQQGGRVDILFLDIELLHLTGIEVADFIRNRMENRLMQIIYISGIASYAQQLFKTQPMDFLIKPITQTKIDDSLDLALKLLGRNMDKFKFQYGRDYYYLPFGEIMYLVSEGRKIRIITLHEEKEFYGKLRDVLNSLPQEFIVIHKSYIVNREHIVRYAYEVVELTDGTVLTISKANRKQVRERLLQEGI
ncbi:MAG TPA: DNA-binding response regulator [Lachnospiraceae bacterium]|nr:DNA-binding response regulator [Lachnospiraceae bacterium]